MFIDTHCHLTWEQYHNEGIASFISRAKNAGVLKYITISTSRETLIEVESLANMYDEVYFACGVHPCDLEKGGLEDIALAIQHPKCLAVGECGLDYFFTKDTKKEQYAAFEFQIQCSLQYQKPLVIHTRSAGQEVLDILHSYQQNNFVVHCFSQDTSFAYRVLDMGGMVSVGGILTFPNAKDLRSTVSLIPLDSIMLETDAPFLAPQSKRGQLNTPEYIPEIAMKLAEIQGVSFEEVARVTTKNANRFFWKA